MRITLCAAALAVALPATAHAFVGYDDEDDPLYGWSDTLHGSDPDSPDYDWESIETSGTEIAFVGDTAGPIDIGFLFDYYEEAYEEIYLSRYGLLGFDTVSSYGPTTIPSASTPNNFVAFAWAYYETYSYVPEAWYLTRGEAPNREFVIEFHGWLYGEEYYYEEVTSQVVLQEGGDILVSIVDGGTGWNTMAVGLEDSDGARGIQAYYDEPWTTPISDYAAIFSSLGERPRVRVLTDDLTVPEGGTLTLEVSVTDRQGDLESIAWDLDGDGYDDGSSETMEVSAADADGPSTLTPKIRAEDEAGNVRELTIEIDVTNVAPEIEGDPVTEVVRGVDWSFDPVIVEPCAADVLTVRATERPDGMTVLGSGGLRWHPTEEDIGEHHIVLVAADDDDNPEVVGDGDDTLEFTLSVLANTAPTQPVIVDPRNGATVTRLQPTLVVETPTDAENDPLTLTFDIDVVDTYDSPNLLTSGPIPVSLGRTGWTVSEELEDGRTYYWRVGAFDGHDEGAKAAAHFAVDLGGGGDGGPDGGSDGGGDDRVETGCRCEVSGQGARSLPLPVALLILALVGLRRSNRE